MPSTTHIRVTEILSPFSGLQNVDANVLSAACERGTKVHSICESIVQGVEPWEIEDEIKGYVSSFEKWLDEGWEITEIERRFFCDKLMLTGQIDFIVRNDNGKHLIVDLKTSSRPSKTWPLQGSAYAYLARENGFEIEAIHFVQLQKNGNRPSVYVYAEDFDLFRKCLDVYNHFFRNKK